MHTQKASVVWRLCEISQDMAHLYSCAVHLCINLFMNVRKKINSMQFNLRTALHGEHEDRDLSVAALCDVLKFWADVYLSCWTGFVHNGISALADIIQSYCSLLQDFWPIKWCTWAALDDFTSCMLHGKTVDSW